jgi:hypothetical protein
VNSSRRSAQRNSVASTKSPAMTTNQPGPGSGMVTMPSATMSPPMTPTAIRYGWLIDRRAAIRRRQRVPATRSRRLRLSSAS